MPHSISNQLHQLFAQYHALETDQQPDIMNVVNEKNAFTLLLPSGDTSYKHIIGVFQSLEAVGLVDASYEPSAHRHGIKGRVSEPDHRDPRPGTRVMNRRYVALGMGSPDKKQSNETVWLGSNVKVAFKDGKLPEDKKLKFTIDFGTRSLAEINQKLGDAAAWLQDKIQTDRAVDTTPQINEDRIHHQRYWEAMQAKRYGVELLPLSDTSRQTYNHADETLALDYLRERIMLTIPMAKIQIIPPHSSAQPGMREESAHTSIVHVAFPDEAPLRRMFSHKDTRAGIEQTLQNILETTFSGLDSQALRVEWKHGLNLTLTILGEPAQLVEAIPELNASFYTFANRLDGRGQRAESAMRASGKENGSIPQR